MVCRENYGSLFVGIVGKYERRKKRGKKKLRLKTFMLFSIDPVAEMTFVFPGGIATWLNETELPVAVPTTDEANFPGLVGRVCGATASPGDMRH